MKFTIKDFFSKCDQIRRKLRIWSHLLKKSYMENFILRVVVVLLNSTHLLEARTTSLQKDLFWGVSTPQGGLQHVSR